MFQSIKQVSPVTQFPNYQTSVSILAEDKQNLDIIGLLKIFFFFIVHDPQKSSHIKAIHQTSSQMSLVADS